MAFERHDHPVSIHVEGLRVRRHGRTEREGPAGTDLAVEQHRQLASRSPFRAGDRIPTELAGRGRPGDADTGTDPEVPAAEPRRVTDGREDLKIAQLQEAELPDVG